MSSMRLRLEAAKRDSKRGITGGKSLFSTPSKVGGLGSAAAALVPCVPGKELVWVKYPEFLCGGRVGSGGNVCLKSIGGCDVETHERSKCDLPLEPFLIPMVKMSPVKGYANVVLSTVNIDEALVTSLLDKTGENWAKEFEIIKSNGTQSIQQEIISKEIVHTSRKQTSFNTPAKKNVLIDLEDKLHDLASITNLVDELGDETVDVDGNRINRSLHLLTDTDVEKNFSDVYSNLEVLCEHAKIVKDLFASNSILMEGFTKPIEAVVAGVRLELASVRGDIGSKNLSNGNVPPGLWNAVETGFTSIQNLEESVTACKSRSDEAYEVADFLLGNSEPGIASTKLNAVTHPEDNPYSSDEESKDVGKTFVSNLGMGKQPRTIRSGIAPKSKAVPPPSFPPSPGHDANGNCDADAAMCSICMNRMDGLESRLINSLMRLSNLEESKSGTIESAIMVKNEVFRGRRDVGAWAQKHFPEEKSMNIECACFSTPHFLLNMMYADMCSKRYATIDLQVKDFKNLGINRPDATAYYALQADKPDFMVATSTCPSHSLKATKQVRDAAPLKFIPSFLDFGTSSDSESMQYRFKQSLEHIRDKQEKYIESRLEYHSNREVMEIATQLLSDSCKFINQMLDFMEELYSACHDSFGASTEAWELVCHCLEELFTKELKPSLKFCVSQDLIEPRNAFIGSLHAAFSLNVKVRELTQVGLKNHHSTTTSHVRFVMKMAKSQRKGGDDKIGPLQIKFDKLQLEHTKLKESNEKEQVSIAKSFKNLESRLDKLRDAQAKASAPKKP